MLKIKKLYSEPPLFNPIKFKNGFNLIFGETTEKTVKTNGVGKSLCIEFINYALLKDHSKSRVSKIPKNELPDDFEIILDFEIGEKQLTIRRNVFNENFPELFVNGKKKPISDKIQILEYLTLLTFGTASTSESPSFRSVLGPLIRDEKSEFKSIIKCFDTDKTIPPDYEPHLYLLGVNPAPYKEAINLYKQLTKIKAAKSKIKSNIETLTGKNISEAKADLNDLKSQVEKTQKDIDRLENLEGFEIVKSEIIALEQKIDDKRALQEILKNELSKIQLFKGDNYINEEEVADLYNQFKDGLGDLIKKELAEVTAFKKKIDDFQRSLINERKDQVLNEIKSISSDLKHLDHRYKEKTALLDQEGVLKNLKKTIAIHQRKFEEHSSLNSFLDAYTVQEKERRDKSIERKNQIHLLDSYVIEAISSVEKIEKYILNMHEYVYGNKQCSFEVDIRENREIVKYDLRIHDDGSHSIDREKVFFYDFALLNSLKSNNKHPGLLIHDNIFEVDRDTLIKNLNYIHDSLNILSDKQYILTLNKDMLSPDDLKKIKLEFNNHVRATFTKENRFLNIDYQELS
ncbi:MAG: DUF2326 domain-containing protein [Candidatus Nitronauta litoralis]|uniref:DUF2326 domain-containing protein n=1 Tax=Candidatus Nitronauta litoralis TaxID=2705533 RepID=A0A7T0FZU0_9BACT|nr:MAG: DUF2326 domain-containing protein [Candidatus Nitronauta litoralis]